MKTFYRVQDDKKPPEKRVIVRIPFLPASSTLSGKHDISRLDSEDLKERLDRELKEIKGVKLSSLQENVADRLSR